MSTNQQPLSQEQLFQAKEIRRHELAKLPIEEKIAVLITMQQWECEIARHAGREHPAPWKLQEFRKSEQ